MGQQHSRQHLPSLSLPTLGLQQVLIEAFLSHRNGCVIPFLRYIVFTESEFKVALVKRSDTHSDLH